MSSQQRSLADPRPVEYRILHEADLRDYLAGLPAIAARLGGAPASWTISEVGDGNLNLVFIVRGRDGSALCDPKLRRSGRPAAILTRRLDRLGAAGFER